LWDCVGDFEADDGWGAAFNAYGFWKGYGAAVGGEGRVAAFGHVDGRCWERCAEEGEGAVRRTIVEQVAWPGEPRDDGCEDNHRE
jgi:hypothetical protein